MNIKYKISICTLILTGLLSTQSCKKYLDVNTDPNNLEYGKATMELALPVAENAIAYVLGNKYQEIGGFLSQYWTQLPSATQYYDYDRYSFDAIDGDREWQQLYAGALKDLQFVEETAIAKKDSNFNAVAKLLSAYAFQMVSDVHGDVPYSEALKASSGILNPKYDAQEGMYAALIAKVDEAMTLLQNSQTSSKIALGDPLFKGDMTMWWKFANTLKMRLVMRQSEKPGFAALLGTLSNNATDYFEAGENAALAYVDKQGNKNPLYASIQGLGVNNNVASKTIGDSLNAYGDPRASFYFKTGGTVAGTLQGAAAAGGYPANSPITALGDGVYGATVPVYFFSGHESLLLQAEKEARKNAAGAQASYEEGVVASFENCGIDTTGLGLFTGTYDFPTTQAEQIKAIAFQKWIAMCGTQNMESWCEVRRLNYPVLKASKATELGNPTDLPARIPYPSNEETGNSNFPGQKDITEKLFWDL